MTAMDDTDNHEHSKDHTADTEDKEDFVHNYHGARLTFGLLMNDI